MKTQKDKQGPESFDCLAYKQRVQAEIYEEIKDLSPTEEVAYFRKSAETGPFAEWWKRVRQESARRRGAEDPAA